MDPPIALPKYIRCPFKSHCPNLIPRVLVCKGISVPEHKGLLFRSCYECHGFQWLSPTHHIQRADSERAQNSFTRMEVSQPVRSVAAADAEAFVGGDIDQATLACLQAIYPEDYPGEPMLGDEELARHLAQMPENFSTFAVSEPDRFNFHNSFSLPDNLGLFGDSEAFGFSFNGDPDMAPDLSIATLQTAVANGFGDAQMRSGLVNEHELFSLGTDQVIGTGILGLEPKVGESAVIERRKKPGTNAYFCVMTGCNLVAKSARCLHQMCKSHCAVQANVCPAHPPSVTATASRIPLSTTTVTNVSAPRDYRSDMTSSHREVWERNKQQQQANLDNKRLRQEYQRLFVQQVTIYAWKTNNSDPISFRDQSISTWPMYNMVNSIALLEKLGLGVHAVVGVYNVVLGIWEDENIDRVFQVVSQQKIFLRLNGVTDCPRFEQLLLAPSLTPGHNSHKRKASGPEVGMETPSPKRLHLDDDTDVSASIPSFLASTSFFLPDSFMTPTSSPAPISSVRTPTPTAPMPTPSAMIPISDSTTPITPDSPTGPRRWPGDLHTCDVAERMCRIAKIMAATSTRTLDSSRIQHAFEKEFPDYCYVRSSFARHMSTWKNSSTQARESALCSARDSQDLWRIWYSRAPSKPSRT